MKKLFNYRSSITTCNGVLNSEGPGTVEAEKVVIKGDEGIFQEKRNGQIWKTIFKLISAETLDYGK